MPGSSGKAIKTTYVSVWIQRVTLLTSDTSMWQWCGICLSVCVNVSRACDSDVRSDTSVWQLYVCLSVCVSVSRALWWEATIMCDSCVCVSVCVSVNRACDSDEIWHFCVTVVCVSVCVSVSRAYDSDEKRHFCVTVVYVYLCVSVSTEPVTVMRCDTSLWQLYVCLSVCVSVSRAYDSDEKRHCYVTVTALPPVGHCVNCSQLSNSVQGLYLDYKASACKLVPAWLS